MLPERSTGVIFITEAIISLVMLKGQGLEIDRDLTWPRDNAIMSTRTEAAMFIAARIMETGRNAITGGGPQPNNRVRETGHR